MRAAIVLLALLACLAAAAAQATGQFSALCEVIATSDNKAKCEQWMDNNELLGSAPARWQAKHGKAATRKGRRAEASVQSTNKGYELVDPGSKYDSAPYASHAYGSCHAKGYKPYEYTSVGTDYNYRPAPASTQGLLDNLGITRDSNLISSTTEITTYKYFEIATFWTDEPLAPPRKARSAPRAIQPINPNVTFEFAALVNAALVTTGLTTDFLDLLDPVYLAGAMVALPAIDVLDNLQLIPAEAQAKIQHHGPKPADFKTEWRGPFGTNGSYSITGSWGVPGTKIPTPIAPFSLPTYLFLAGRLASLDAHLDHICLKFDAQCSAYIDGERFIGTLIADKPNLDLNISLKDYLFKGLVESVWPWTYGLTFTCSNLQPYCDPFVETGPFCNVCDTECGAACCAAQPVNNVSPDPAICVGGVYNATAAAAACP